MSHPVPTHTYGENEYESHSPHKEGGVRPSGKKKTSFSGEWNIIKRKSAELKRMIDEPSEKAWFVKHGLPKGIHATAKGKALENKTHSKEHESVRRLDQAIVKGLNKNK